MDKRLTDNLKLIDQLKNKGGRWTPQSLSDKAFKQYIENANAQIKIAKQYLDQTKAPNHLYNRQNLIELLKHQDYLNTYVDLGNSSAYFKTLSKQALVDRKDIVKYIKSVNNDTLRKAHIIEDKIIRRIPKLIKDLNANNHQKFLKSVAYDKRYYSKLYAKWYKILRHNSYAKVVNKAIADDKKHYEHRKAHLDKLVADFIPNFRMADDDDVSLFKDSMNMDGSFNWNISGSSIDEFSAYKFKNKKLYEKTAPKKYKLVKNPSNFLIMLVLEAHLFFLPYLQDPDMIADLHAFKSDLNVENVFIQNNYYFGNQSSSMNTSGLYFEAFNWYSADKADETSQKPYVSDPNRVADYLNFENK